MDAIPDSAIAADEQINMIAAPKRKNMAGKRRVSLVIAGSLAGTTTDLRKGRIVLALQARSGKTFDIAKRNHPRKISHVADAVETPGI
jgi:hypothetical protein